MIRLTQIHWLNGEEMLMLINSKKVTAIAVKERDGKVYSQVMTRTHTFTVKETIEEIEKCLGISTNQ